MTISDTDKKINAKGVLTSMGGGRGFATPFIMKDCSELRSLGKHEQALGGLLLRNLPNLENLGDLTRVQGTLHISGCPKLKSLGNLKIVTKNLLLRNSSVIDLGSLSTVGGTIELGGDVLYTSVGPLSVSKLAIQAGHTVVPENLSLSTNTVYVYTNVGVNLKLADGAELMREIRAIYKMSMTEMIAAELTIRNSQMEKILEPLLSRRKKGIL